MLHSSDRRKKILDYYAGKLTPAEQEELLQWMDTQPEKAIESLFSKEEWNNIKPTPLTPAQLDAALQKIKGGGKTIPMVSKRNIIWYWRAAAVILVIITGGFLTVQLIKGQAGRPVMPVSAAIHYHTVKVADGSRSRLALPDGSIITVNGGSELSIPDQFASNSREIKLVAGEAYFEVVKDADRPFTVHSNNLDIKVLGTAFSVRDYPDERSAEAGVTSGKIAVTKTMTTAVDSVVKGNNELLYLEAGDKLTLQKTQSTFTKESIDISVASAWIRGELIFHSATLHHVLNVLKHRYAVSFDIQRTDLEEEKFSATFRNNNLETILQQLQLMSGIQYTIQGKEILIQ